MAYKLWKAALLVILINEALSEESFCDNKCFGEGVVTSRSCYCDKACTIYKDCCSDSKHFDPSKDSDSSSSSVVCKRNTLVVNSCLPEWKGPDFIIKSCQESHNEVDPVGNSPVTSETTGISYSNYYCAICNGDSEEAIVWTIKVSCPLLNPSIDLDKEEAFKYIFYNIPTKEWGYVSRENSTQKLSFHACAVISEVPEKFSSKVRKCSSDEVRSCSPNWKINLVERMCDAYSDPVFHNVTKYKNLYCAICNNVDQSLLNCGDGIGPRMKEVPESEEKNNLSFSLLLDINFSEGNIVGRRLSVMNCLPGEIFDPFARRCRNIVCAIPGYILQNGLCIAGSASPI
ncbi:uncharacterized protein [Parasteatoda tepidariorum]|uniref:uncharacterized protein n=1 Tax=Parasteatoda tepidariorum TaxID=114398 RepID=UPI00077FBE7B|nr:uncharacterized protein LOC107437549 [Parasteatoda tepidariorum]